jgi:hypothetical protein
VYAESIENQGSKGEKRGATQERHPTADDSSGFQQEVRQLAGGKQVGHATGIVGAITHRG